MARLVVTSGSENGRVVDLPAYAIVFGRDPACDVLLDDPRASRQHACIQLRHGEWCVRDLGSANGTTLDGKPVTDWTPLRHGALLRIGRTALRVEDEAPPAPPRGDLPLLPGYEVLERVGLGATGTVYRARQIALDRIVALKVLAPRYAADPETVERFVREARAAAAISHPHVVPVYDVKHHGDLHYFSMEFMEGGTVEDLLLSAPESRLPWRQAVRIVSSAAAGLAHLHANGLVHRDIKPANLLLDRERVVKLGDLGTLVRADEALGERIGTPHFMSPEQARRKAVTRASDVYSLGATLYRMLAGRTPHVGQTVDEVLQHVANETPTPLAELRPEIPREVSRLVESMMSRDQRARPADAKVLAREFEATLVDIRQAAQSARQSRRLRASLTGWVIAVAILGLLAWGVSREQDLRRWLRDRRPTAVVHPPIAVGTPSAPTPAQIAAEKLEEIRARERGLQPLAATTESNAAQWREIAADYARLAEVFPIDSEAVVRGHWRAKEIRDHLARATGGDAENQAFADRWVARALREDADAAAPPIADASTPPEVPAAVEEIASERDALLASADGLVARRRIQDALDLVLGWVREQRALARQNAAPSEVHEAIAVGIAWMRRTTSAASARLEQDLDRDRTLLRAHFGSTALFQGDAPAATPERALARLEAVDPLLVTYLAGELMEGRRARLRAIAALWPVVAASATTREDVIANVERTLPEHPEDRAAALWLLLEAGATDPADALLASWTDVPPDTAREAQAEIAALRARAAGAGAEWFAAHAGAHATLLSAGTHAADHPVFSDAGIERYYETWGGAPQ